MKGILLIAAVAIAAFGLTFSGELNTLAEGATQMADLLNLGVEK